MVSPRLRSRSLKRNQIKLPGGRTAQHYIRRKPSQLKCALCKAPLSGIPRLRPKRMHNIPKSKLSVARPYGGSLCSRCSRDLISQKARSYNF